MEAEKPHVTTMVEFTDEQKAEIAKMMEEQRKVEQYRIAGDQAYRAAIMHLKQNPGLFDQFVVSVFQNEYELYLQRMFPQAAPAKKGDSAKGEPVKGDAADEESE